MISVDFEVGRVVLVVGGEVAKKVEISGVAIIVLLSFEVGRFFEI